MADIEDQWFSEISRAGDYRTMHIWDGDGDPNRVYEINFEGGYINRADVKAFMVETLTQYRTDLTVNFTNGNTVTLSQAVPAGTHKVTIYRDTPKGKPLASFVDGAIINASNLDRNAKQAVFSVAEMVDRFDSVVADSEDALRTAYNALGLAQNAINVSDQAKAQAAQAELKADVAVATAQGADVKADAAVVTANDAKATAEGIDDTAQQALDNSVAAVNTADAAEATANAIDGKAQQALDNSTAAVNTANQAKQTADGVDAKATQALTNSQNAVAAVVNSLQKNLNLSDLTNRQEAWMNVRPVGSTPLSSDAVNDYDAPTFRQVKNMVSAGTGGPTMNGVMNYHVGEAVAWETRAYYPPNTLPRDGQLVNRADWPELWAWAQKTTPISDTAWLADPTQRGKYSSGNGTTTFRLPDWNGVQSGSIPAVFFRGGVGAADMIMALNAAPDVTGQLATDLNGTAWLPVGSFNAGAFKPTNQVANTYKPNGGTFTPVVGNGAWDFKASYSNESYGRNNAGEVVPNKVSGVWLVRASGGFVAANTSWSVKNRDSSTPGAGVSVKGGTVQSTYDAPNLSVKAGFEATHNTTEQTTGVTRVSMFVTDKNGVTNRFEGDSLGNFGIPDMMLGQRANYALQNDRDGICITLRRDVVGGGTRFGGSLVMGFNRMPHQYDYYPQINTGGTYSVFSRLMDAPGGNARAVWAKHSDGNYTAYNGSFVNGSDVRIKKNISRIENALEKMWLLKGCTWKYKANDSFGIGFLAQDVEKLFPGAVTEHEMHQEFDDGTVLESVKSMSAGNVAAALHHEAILEMALQIEELKKELAELKANKEV